VWRWWVRVRLVRVRKNVVERVFAGRC
jgi:hypothetical protein